MNRILITGASSSIGNNLIKKIDKKNQIIVAHYNKSKNFLNFIKSKKLKSKIITIKSDFSKKNDFNYFLKKIKKYNINMLVHIASKRISIKRFEKINLKDFHEEINLSFDSIIEIIKLIIPNMLKKKKGRVVFVLSSVTFNKPASYLTHYVCLKYLLLGLIKSLASEFKNTGINFNSISPTMMETPFIKNLNKKFIEINKSLSKNKKLLKLNKVVNKIDHLLYSKSKNLNGKNFLLKN